MNRQRDNQLVIAFYVLMGLWAALVVLRMMGVLN